MTAGWESRAECKGKDPRIFFPVEHSGRGGQADYAQARCICARCEVTAECLEANLREFAGMFGGMDPNERRLLRNRRQRSSWPSEHRASRERQGRAS